MRLLLALCAFLALAVAPLGLPAEARTAEEHCAEMAGMNHHQPASAPDHGSPAAVKSCCVAMAAALPEAAAGIEASALKPLLISFRLHQQHGLRREVEVPPPRA